MYGKIFKQMYDGSMAKVGDWQAIVTFQQMIVLADKEGVVDMTPEAIARITTIPLDIIQSGIKSLEQTDSSSRTPDEEGRRIIRLREHSDWGWRLTNYVKYSEIRSAEERRAYHRRYYHEKRKTQPESTPSQHISTDSTDVSRSRTVSGSYPSPTPTRSPPISLEIPLSDGDGNVDQEKRKPRKPLAVFDCSTVVGLDLTAWREWLTYRDKRKPLRHESLRKAAEAMAKLGPQQRAAVDHSIANGYQGLIAPNGATNGRDVPRPTRYAQLTAKLDRQIAEDEEGLASDDGPVRGSLAGDVRGRTIPHLGEPDREP